jgi:hypothetical protein
MKHAKHSAEPKAELPPLSPAIDPRDADAMVRAIAWIREHGSVHDVEAIERELNRDGFQAAAETAAYRAQCATLRLRPWQAPPVHVCGEGIDPNVYGHRPAEIGLRDRLLAANLSLLEPDPLAALERCGA